MFARDVVRLLAGAGLVGVAVAWSHMAPAPRVEIGTRTEPVSLEVVSGGTGRLMVGGDSDTVTVLDFFASWCAACRRSVPRLERAVARSDVCWIAVSVDDSPEIARRAAAEWGLEGAVAFDAGGRLAKQLGVRALPTIVVLAEDGTVAETAVGPIDAPELGQLVERGRRSTAAR